MPLSTSFAINRIERVGRARRGTMGQTDTSLGQGAAICTIAATRSPAPHALKKESRGTVEAAPARRGKTGSGNSLSGSHQRAQAAGPLGSTQLAQRLGLDLADSLTGDIEFLPDLF